MTQLNTMMAALRSAESGSYDGAYDQVRIDPITGVKLLGAYGVPASKWSAWAEFAGAPGASWSSPLSQDFVAGHVLSFLFRRYGSWEIAMAAWYGGTVSGDRIAGRGYQGLDSIQNKDLRDSVRTAITRANAAPADLPMREPIIQHVAAHGWVFPVAGKYDKFTDSYGYQRTESQIAAGRRPTHRGIDIHAAAGTPLVSPVPGVVESAGWSDVGGNYVTIRGNDGYRYYFAHMANPASVATSDPVRAGEVVGAVGNSGNAQDTEPHLHMEMKQLNDMSYTNPYPYLQAALEQGGMNQAGSAYADIQPGNRIAEMMGGLVESLSTTIAGGERVDYRQISEQEGNEPL